MFSDCKADLIYNFFFFRVAIVVLLALICTCQSINLECEFSEFELGEETLRLCLAKNLIVANPNETVTSINGNTEVLTDVHTLIINGQVVNYFPTNIHSFFPNLNFIRVISSSLKSIVQADLKPFTKLEKFSAEDNDLVELDSDLFEGNTELRWIQFWNNNLNLIGENIFTPLEKLEFAEFSSNQCIDFNVWGREEIHLLQAWIVSNCKAASGDEQAAELETTKAQNVWYSEQKRVAESDFKASSKVILSMLERQGVWEDRYRNFAFELVCMLSGIVCKVEATEVVENDEDTEVNYGVKRLVIHKKSIVFIPTNLDHLFPNLNKLLIKNSGVIAIDTYDFMNMTNLIYLNLENNAIRNVPAETFIGLQDLKMLHLTSNLIETLEPRAFAGLSSLTFLSLADNWLSSVNSEAFDGLQNLVTLLLNDNRLQIIDPNVLFVSPNLENVIFVDNICTNLSTPSSSLSEIADDINQKCANQEEESTSEAPQK